MTESRGLRRERNSPTRTGQRLRLPGERFPALNSLWDQELEEEKTPQCSPHPQGIPFARKGTETQLSGFHFSVPDTGFLIKKKKRKKEMKKKEGREGGGRFQLLPPLWVLPLGLAEQVPRDEATLPTSEGGKRAATRSGHQAHRGALAAPGACPAGGICQEGRRWGRAGEAGGRQAPPVSNPHGVISRHFFR